jgi:tartrate-resistant acid phosphatase type 5
MDSGCPVRRRRRDCPSILPSLAACLLTLLPSAAASGRPGAIDAAARTVAKAASGRSVPPATSLLPAELRGSGSAILAANPRDRAKLAGKLAEQEPARAKAFLISILDHDETPAVRLEIVDRLGTQPGGDIRQALERHATSDPDVGVSLLALERLRERTTAQLRELLAARLEAARGSGDRAAAVRLGDEDERWISLVHGVMLPSFLRRSPPPFEVKPAGQSVRAVAFGDFGDGSENQRATAAAVRNEHARKPFDFGLTLGDNFYEKGSEGPRDPRWKSWWEDMYGPLGIRFYASLGNHDWKLPDSPAAEILYSSPSWSMPSPYYTFTAGDAQFFVLDTNEVSAAQLAWLSEALAQSRATWKIVYGHHPIYSAGQHGDTQRLVDALLPVLRDRADAYFCGHDHDMQHLRPDGGVHFFVAGSGGAHQRPMHPHPRTLFARTDIHGFATLEADAGALTVRFIADDGSELYAYTLHKSPPR